MASRVFAAVAFLFSLLCVAVRAQTPTPQSAPAGNTPTAAPVLPTLASPTSPVPSSPAPSAGGATLPAIQVTAGKRAKTPANKPQPARTATPVAPTAPVPVSPYETGAPNVAGGAPVVPQLASQMTISGADLNARPVTRPGEILEAAPGLAVVMHADGGKANQYYLRGYNLDHGTDMATFVDDVPINLPTHAHGQGYTDLNFLIPETVGGLEVRKGPYFADVGDFASAGDLHVSLRDSVEQNIQSMTVGSFGYNRLLTLGSTKAGNGSLLYAGEFNTYDGPWTTSDDVRKFSGLLRYSQGTATDGFSATAMAYTNTWNSTDQVALRGFTTGQMGLYGELDPTDGGDTNRFSLSARMAKSDDDGSWKANAYLVKYNLNLFNNYTWHLDDFTNGFNGDQFHQHDDRVYGGANASRTVNGSLFNMPTETVFGVQSRYDDINVGLSNTVQRQFLSNVLYDHVNEGNAGIYAENTVHWNDWLRTTTGWRGDYFDASVNSMLQPANSGKSQSSIGSPKFTMTFGPFAKTEFFVGAGMGYHSNDARSVTVTQTPGDPTTPEGSTPFLVRSRGAEIGVRTKAIPDLDSSVSLFYLHQDSELFFDGDSGDTTAGLPSQRTGIEFTNDYHPTSWAHIDADLALTRARFLGFDTTQDALFTSLAGTPQAQIGNAPGNFIFNAPWMVASAGITLGEKTGWFSSLRWRYISSRPLTEDGVFQSPPSNLFNGAVGYHFDNGWSVTLDALNMLNSTTDNATYAYGSLLTTDALYTMCKSATPPPAAVCANGVMDYVYHPMEPTAFRLTLAGPLETIGKVNVREMATELGRSVSFAPVQAANYDWTGFYVGAHLDTTWSKTSGSTTNNAAGAVASADSNTSQWHGGIQLGYDYMMPSRIVVGIAADVTSGSAKTVTTTDASGISSNKTTVFDSETLRGRLGYAFDSVLLYGTAGWAWSNDQFVRTQLGGVVNLATAGTDEAVNKYLSGWTLGGGAALAIAQNWNVFAEYRYTNYGSTSISLPFSGLTTASTTKVSSLELGVNYKFNWNAAQGPGYAGIRPFVPLSAAPRSPYPYNWGGIYVGADGGYGLQMAKGTLTDATGAVLAPYSYGVMGPFAGGYVGVNYQFNCVVAGVEGDWQWSNLIGNNQTLAPIVAGAGPFTISSTTKDYGSVRARLGIAADRWLIFGTGGWAWGDPTTDYALTGLAPFTSNGGSVSSGWTAGAGVEYALTENVLGRVEYRYTDLKMSGFVNVPEGAAGAPSNVPISDLRAGFAYKFGSDVFAESSPAP
jgi:opacity protein-like surface antigen